MWSMRRRHTWINLPAFVVGGARPRTFGGPAPMSTSPYPLLNGIHLPADLRALPEDRLEQV